MTVVTLRHFAARLRCLPSVQSHHERTIQRLLRTAAMPFHHHDWRRQPTQSDPARGSTGGTHSRRRAHHCAHQSGARADQAERRLPGAPGGSYRTTSAFHLCIAPVSSALMCRNLTFVAPAMSLMTALLLQSGERVPNLHNRAESDVQQPSPDGTVAVARAAAAQAADWAVQPAAPVTPPPDTSASGSQAWPAAAEAPAAIPSLPLHSLHSSNTRTLAAGDYASGHLATAPSIDTPGTPLPDWKKARWVQQMLCSDCTASF